MLCNAWLLNKTMLFQLPFSRNQVIHLLNHTQSLMILRGEKTWGRACVLQVNVIRRKSSSLVNIFGTL